MIQEGDMVYLSMKNLNLPKGQARKLCPKYVGPYKVLKANPETSNYTLQLPQVLQEHHLHPTFYVSLLRPFILNNDVMFPNRVSPESYDFGTPNNAEWFVDELLGHRWRKGNEFEIRWSLGDTTWEPYANCKDLAALDQYIELQGVKAPQQLKRHGPTK